MDADSSSGDSEDKESLLGGDRLFLFDDWVREAGHRPNSGIGAIRTVLRWGIR